MYPDYLSKISVLLFLKEIIALEMIPMLSLPAIGGWEWGRFFLSYSVLADVMDILGNETDYMCY